MEARGGFLISQIKQLQGRIFEKLLSGAGIEAFNGAQGRILYVLWQKDGLPIVELSRKTGLAKTTLTSMLDRLSNQELIEKCSDMADRRQTKIYLTQKAKQLSKSYTQVSEEMYRIFYDGISNEDVIRFENTLNHILKNLEESESKK